MKIFHSPHKGFTLVELLVAIALFSVVMSIAVGGFARAMKVQRQSAGLLLANSNASLVFEQMVREIRLGHSFCQEIPCTDGVLSFRNANKDATNPEGELVLYCRTGGAGFGAIHRGTGGVSCENAPQITANNVDAHYLTFRFSRNGSAENYPPRITISLGVSSREPGVSGSPVRLETTVSARAIGG